MILFDISSWVIEHIYQKKKSYYSVRGNHASAVNTYITKITL